MSVTHPALAAWTRCAGALRCPRRNDSHTGARGSPSFSASQAPRQHFPPPPFRQRPTRPAPPRAWPGTPPKRRTAAEARTSSGQKGRFMGITRSFLSCPSNAGISLQRFPGSPSPDDPFEAVAAGGAPSAERRGTANSPDLVIILTILAASWGLPALAQASSAELYTTVLGSTAAALISCRGRRARADGNGPSQARNWLPRRVSPSNIAISPPRKPIGASTKESLAPLKRRGEGGGGRGNPWKPKVPGHPRWGTRPMVATDGPAAKQSRAPSLVHLVRAGRPSDPTSLSIRPSVWSLAHASSPDEPT